MREPLLQQPAQRLLEPRTPHRLQRLEQHPRRREADARQHAEVVRLDDAVDGAGREFSQRAVRLVVRPRAVQALQDLGEEARRDEVRDEDLGGLFAAEAVGAADDAHHEVAHGAARLGLEVA